jgi:dTDP-4-dehydrorhamnose 3,5-epimerase
MIFSATPILGAILIKPEKIRDERGFFARTFCQREFEGQGLNLLWIQSNVSFNLRKATLRGMHYQEAPFSEIKMVRCTGGAIYDVIVDIRPDSATFRKWYSVELTSLNHKALYIPVGVAHGFETLSDESEVLYWMSEFYAPGSARGFRYDDASFEIDWPLPVETISPKDLTWPAFERRSGA